MPDRPPDQRKEPRFKADGIVEILCEEDPTAAPITARLLDVSASGFRAAHSGCALSRGQTVRFRHPSASGRARVVWNRIDGDVTETGFVLV